MILVQMVHVILVYVNGYKVIDFSLSYLRNYLAIFRLGVHQLKVGLCLVSSVKYVGMHV